MSHLLFSDATRKALHIWKRKRNGRPNILILKKLISAG
jgi:hypothetical protein